MKEFDYIIIGGGCAGLSLAYELEIYDKLKNKTLAIIEPREEYKRDKTWSFWKVFPHNFDDCIINSWNNFTINTPDETKHVDCQFTPYQTIDSGMFYEKILSKLKLNQNIHFFKNIDELDKSNSIVFNSVPNFENKQSERDKDRVRENVCERDREGGKTDAVRSLVTLHHMTIT